MKVLSLLPLAVAVTALPARVNLRVYKIDEQGNAELENVREFDYNEEHKTLKELIHDFEHVAPLPVDIVESTQDVEVAEVAEEQVQNKQPKNTKNILDSFLSKSYNAFSDVFGYTITDITENEQSTKPKAHGNRPIHVGKKGGCKSKKQRLAKLKKAVADRKLTKEDLENYANAHGLSAERTAKFLQAHGFEQTPEVQSTESTSKFESVKQMSQDLYHDVKSINYKESFNQISQDPNAVCAVGSGIVGGLGFLVFLTLLFHTVRRIKARRIRLEDEEEETPMSEKH